MCRISEVLAQDGRALQTVLFLSSQDARSETQTLLQHALNVNRAHLLAHPEQELDAAQTAAYRALLQRRLAGEPIAYILGGREFHGLNFKVTPATLIPRPETELLVELAWQHISSPPAPLPLAGEGGRQAGGGGSFRVLDLGTGSGAIALSIAHARPDAEVTAVDASMEALEVARENAQRLNIANTRFVQSDWYAQLAGERFDLIVANPPYIADDDTHLAQGDLRYEPRSALASGADGLDDIRRIIGGANAHLTAGSWLLLEHGYDQAVAVRGLLLSAGFNGVFSATDLAGIERVSGGGI